ncbi:AraC family transcriptional regulator [Bradyrhizobium macuxiense]|uniref:AraC family transcriptional regulator n=1 Tax=Bradyrhizobium macuxiense TaxID=1755647 RepID=UPI001FD88D4E|nr:helix-turn-helix domain-containing protein [Bradyrhizobium macuxiense]
MLLALDAVLQLRNSRLGRITLLFDLCGIAFLIETAPQFRDSHAVWVLFLRVASNMAAAVFALWSEEVFDDTARPPWIGWTPVGLMALLAIWSVVTDSSWAWLATHVSAVMLVVITIGRVLLGRANDLIEVRRRDRVVFAWGLGLAIVGCTLIGSSNVGMTPALPGVVGIALAAALFRLHRASPITAVAAAPPVSGPASSTSEMTEAEAALYRRLLRLMEVERAYRDGSLTIASLAKQLDTPEYRVRQLINQRLGYGNFARFVNSYRLAEARSALADAGQARVPILTIALDAGFESIGPFNRAFKAVTGETPSTFRKRTLAGPV